MGLTVIISHEKDEYKGNPFRNGSPYFFYKVAWSQFVNGNRYKWIPVGQKVGIRGYGRCKSPVQAFAWTGFFTDLMAYTKVCFLFLLLRV